MGRQQQAGGPGQHGHASALGTATPAWTGQVLSPPPAKGGPQLQGAGAHLCWTTLPHVCASESSSRPSFPSRYLARSLRVTIPTTCRERDAVQPDVGTQSLGTACPCPLEEPRLLGHSEQGLTSLRLSTTTKCRRPRARKSLNTRGRDASCKAERGWVGLQHPQPAPIAHPDPWGAVQRGPWPLPGARCRARGS